MCNAEHSSWLNFVLEKTIIPLLLGAISYVFVRKLDEWKKRKTSSILGAIIIDSLLEEVNNGLNFIVKFENQNLPCKSWIGINTLPDEVLLRIINVSKDVKPIGEFHPKDIRKHTKNYFDHMCVSWNNAIPNYNKQIFESSFVVFPKATQGVKDILEQTKQLLENNSKKWFPR